MSKLGKRILNVTIKRMIDDSPDTSWLGEYSSSRDSDESIDRKHTLDCPINTGIEPAVPASGVDEEYNECTCDERGDWLRGEYQYFNPSGNYTDETPEDRRKYTHADYKRMEAMNEGDWYMLGIRAEAEVQLTPMGTIQRITSGGLWGVESDSDDAYLAEVEGDELGELRRQLEALGFGRRAIATAVKQAMRKDA